MDKKKQLLIIILVGGSAVLGSYVLGALTQPGAVSLLWGGVPQGIRPFYTVAMFLGAGGYFAFTYFVFFQLVPDTVRVAGRFGFGLFNALYAAILLPSALWMPLTLLAAKQPGPALSWLVRLDLWTVAAASLGLLWALLAVEPRQPRWAHRLALVGSILFCLQTVILDAIVWVIFYT
jgi:hypothetical protein